MKISELTGVRLDWWVARIEFLGGILVIGDYECCFVRDELYSPSTDWAQGGPIIEREGIRWQPTPLYKEAYYCWKNWENVHEEPLYGEHGSTLLEAAMRCYVASKFGEEVTDESVS